MSAASGDPSARRPCLRCGDFIGPPNEVLDGLELCCACLEPVPVPPLPPRAVRTKRTIFIIAYMILLTAAGIGAEALAGGALRAPGPLGLIPRFAVIPGFLVLGFALSFFFVIRRIHHVGVAAWKRDLVAVLRLADVPDLRFGIAGRKSTQFMPALLAETEAGFVLLGVAEDSVYRLDELASVSVSGVLIGLPRSALRLERKDGSFIFFTFLEAPRYAQNRRLAEEHAARALARLRSRRGAGRSPPGTP